MTHKISIRGSLLMLAVLPLLTTGCGGDGNTGGGLFGSSSQSVATQSNSTPGASSGGLTPNAAPLSTATGGGQTGAASGPSSTAAAASGSLTPLSGTYSGTWTPAAKTDAGKDAAPVPAVSGAPAPASSTTAAAAKSAVPITAAPAAGASVTAAAAAGGAVTLNLAYPKHPSKTVLGDVSGTWADSTLGGVGKISGTVDKIGLPRETNAVHIVGRITFPHGKSRTLAVELAEETVGHLIGSEAGDTISLKKT